MQLPGTSLQRMFDRPVAYWLTQAVLVGVVCATCLISLHLHELRFSGFDVSPMIDGGWRVYLGQAAGRDFIGTSPASLNLGVALAYHLFGVTWRAIGIAASLLTGILCLLGLRVANLLRSTLGDGKVTVLTFVYVATQLTTLIYINYLWHASMAQQIGMYAVLTTVVLLVNPVSPRLTAECSLHLLLALPILVLSKPNTAFPVVGLCFGALWVGKRNRVYLGSLAVTVLLLSSLLLRAAHMNLLSMLEAYKGLTGRLIPKALVAGLFYGLTFWAAINIMTWLLLIPLLSVAIPRMWRHRRDVQPSIALLSIGSVAISLIGYCTNFDYKMTDDPLLLIGIAIFVITSRRTQGLLTSRLVITTVGLALVGLFLGLTRSRMQIAAQWAAEDCGSRVRITDAFFNQLSVCRAFPQTLAEVDQAVAHLPPNPSVFFGSSLEFLYARQHLTPPLGLPVWWDPGTSHPRSASPRIVQAWKSDHFELLIFAHDFLQPMLPEIDADIRQHYTLVSETSNISVYRRRGN